MSRGIRPRWPIGFRRNYHLLSYFLPGLFTSVSLSFSVPPYSSSRRKNLSSSPQGDFTRTCSLVLALACPESPNPSWRPDSPVLRSSLPFPAHTHIHTQHTHTVSLSVALPLVPSYPGPFHSIFYSLTLFYYYLSHSTFSLSVYLVRNSSIISPLHHQLPTTPLSHLVSFSSLRKPEGIL